MEEKLEEITQEDDVKRLVKPITVTKKGYPAMWIQTFRFMQPKARYGAAAAFCASTGKLEKIMRTGVGYFKSKSLVRISTKGIYIEANYALDSDVVKMYKVENIDMENRTVTLKRVATRIDGRWDNTSYMRVYKEGVHSAVIRKKKAYCLRDID